MSRHKKHYSPEEINLLIRAKAEVDEKMKDKNQKRFINNLGGVWEFISKFHFDSKRKGKALAEQYRKEHARAIDTPVSTPPSKDERQLELPHTENNQVLVEMKKTNELLQQLCNLVCALYEEILTRPDQDSVAGELVVPEKPDQDGTFIPAVRG